MRLRGLAHRGQDRVLGALGRVAADRASIVRAMLQPKPGEAAGYWLQLVIATMLATLGLALNSTAVVIGAMLIAPLMKPLVDLAMGLATGSAGLALRAVIRTVASIVLVIVVATAITSLLPFHDITPELEARTVPSLLDLAVAGACALAAAYATLRADADIATTAAGTSIGISLVPPLCSCGYGIALGDGAVSRGAALLFTANLSGILVVTTLMFVIAGFAQIDLDEVESAVDDAASKHAAVRLGRAWSTRASTRLGASARVVPPLLLLAIVFVPLARAVGEIKRRNEIQQVVAHLLGPNQTQVVQYTLEHTARGVALRAVVVGDAHTADELKKQIEQHLVSLGVTDSELLVWAVPDSASLTALAHRVNEIPPPVVPEPAPQIVHRYSSEVAKLLRDAWPTSGAGELVGIWLDLDHPDHVRITHLGTPLGPAGTQLLARVVEPAAGHLDIEEDALSPAEAEAVDGPRWLVGAIDLLARARQVPELRVCLTILKQPVEKRRGVAEPPEVALVRTTLETLITGATDVTKAEGDRWRLEVVRGSCPAAPATPVAPAK